MKDQHTVSIGVQAKLTRTFFFVGFLVISLRIVFLGDSDNCVVAEVFGAVKMSDSSCEE